MPLMNGEWRDFFPYQTRQFVFAHHNPIPGQPFTIISDRAALRIVGNVVRGIGERGCWGYRRQRTASPTIAFQDPAGEQHCISGNRFALLLRADEPIPPGKTANHASGCSHWCMHPGHIYQGTQSENMLDAYADGRRTRPPATWYSLGAEAHARLQADRIARQGREIRCQRFFCDEIRQELAAATTFQSLAQSA